MLSLSIEKQMKRQPFETNCFADGWAANRRAEGPALSNENIFYDCSLLLFQMLSKNIEKQRKRQLFFKSCLAKEMLAIFEIMFGGRICGCYILTISIEKQRKCPPFVFLKYFWRTDERATGGADPNATRNWCFVEADGVYF